MKGEKCLLEMDVKEGGSELSFGCQQKAQMLKEVEEIGRFWLAQCRKTGKFELLYVQRGGDEQRSHEEEEDKVIEGGSSQIASEKDKGLELNHMESTSTKEHHRRPPSKPHR